MSANGADPSVGDMPTRAIRGSPSPPGAPAPSPAQLDRPGVFRLGSRQGEPFWTDDTVTVLKAGPDRTGGRLAVLEQLLVAGRPRPARVDADGDEVVYLLEGIIDVTVGSDRYTLEPGGMLFVPHGEPVGITVLSDTARTLIVITPAAPATLDGIVGG
jgi:quercetin dioxygenase-like cupin family protein